MTTPTTLKEVQELVSNNDTYNSIEQAIRSNTPPSGNGYLGRDSAERYMRAAYDAMRDAGITYRLHSFYEALHQLLEVKDASRSWPQSPYENSPIWGARWPFVECIVAANLAEGGIASEEGRAILGVLANHFNHAYGRHGVKITAESIDSDIEMAQWEQSMHRESRRHVEAESGVTITFTTFKALEGGKDHTNLGNAQKDAGGVQTVVFRAEPGHFPDDIAERLMSSNAGIHAELSVKDGTQYLLVGTAPAGVDGMMRKSESSKNAEAANIVRTVLAEGLITAEEAAGAGVQAKQTHR